MKVKSFFLTLVFLLATPAAGLAQVGRIQGTVTDGAGNPLKGAEIRIEGMGVNRKYKLKTNKKGKYMHVGIVYQGRYRIIVTLEGYQRDYLEGARPTMDPFDKERGTYDFELTQGAANAQLAFELSDEERARINKKVTEEERAAALQEQLTEAFDHGQELLKNGQYADAIEVFQSAIQLDEAQPAMWTALGQAYQRVKRPQDALAAYEKTVVLEPNAAVYQNMGNIYGDLKEPEKAQEMYDKSLEMSAGSDPSVTAGTFYNMAVGHINASNNEQAREALLKALEADPNHAEAHYQLGILLSQRRVTIPAGLEHLRQYLELTPGGPNAEMAQMMIEALG